MEKFGIFELLDALSALTAQNGETLSPKQTDAAYRPPVYGELPPEKEEGTPPPPASGPDALADFLARHDAVAKRAEKRR